MGRYDPQKHRRRSIRLKGYDYSQAGTYFVTLITQGRTCLFGSIMGSEMDLSHMGQICADAWLWLEQQYHYVELDAWVIMPNHLHGIIVICDDMGSGDPGDVCRGGSRTAPTDAAKRKPLGRLIGAFKTVSTKHVNELRQTPGAVLWQRNYYEHIIRDEPDLNRIRQYILESPLRWEEDRENPTRQSQPREAGV